MCPVHLINKLNDPNYFEQSLTFCRPGISLNLRYYDGANHYVIGVEDPSDVINEGIEPYIF